MDAITSFSYKPLRLCFALASLSAFIVAILALSALLVQSTIDSVALGVTASVFMVGGMLLLCLGVLGEYLGRVYDEVRGRPLSIINKVYQAPALMEAQGRIEYQDGDASIAYAETEPVIAFKVRAG
jgi:dolichol-phosphate mannosyltransferase